MNVSNYEKIQSSFADPNRTRLCEMIEDGVIDGKKVALELISWLSDDECKEFMAAYDYNSSLDDEIESSQSSLKEELEKQMKERHLKLNPDGETPDLSAAVEYIEQNDDWYIGTDEQKARKWIRDTLENSDDLITSSVNKDKIYSRESKKDFNERMTAFNKIGADDFDEVVEDAIGADTYADFKKKILKVYPDFEEEKLRDIWYGTGDYVDPAEGRDKPRKMKTRDYDAIYGDDVYSLGSYDD